MIKKESGELKNLQANNSRELECYILFLNNHNSGVIYSISSIVYVNMFLVATHRFLQKATHIYCRFDPDAI